MILSSPGPAQMQISRMGDLLRSSIDLYFCRISAVVLFILKQIDWQEITGNKTIIVSVP